MMDEKNAYTELQKQTRAKAKARREASKQIKALAEKKEKVISKYEQAAEDKTCMTFHQYCRKKWASEVGIESVPDDDETDAVWQEKLNGTKNFRILYSTKTDKSGKIFFCLILRGDVPIIVGHAEDVEQETHYELLIHAWDTETGYIWVGDNRDGGLTRIDYLISGDMTGKQNFIENLITQSYVQKTSEEEEKHE